MEHSHVNDNDYATNHQLHTQRHMLIGNAIEAMIKTIDFDREKHPTKVLNINHNRIVGLIFPRHYGTSSATLRKAIIEPDSIIVNFEMSKESFSDYLWFEPSVLERVFKCGGFLQAMNYIKTRSKISPVKRVYIDTSITFKSYTRLAEVLAEYADPHVVIVKL